MASSHARSSSRTPADVHLEGFRETVQAELQALQVDRRQVRCVFGGQHLVHDSAHCPPFSGCFRDLHNSVAKTQKPQKRGAGGGTRTRTTFYGPGILSPVRLPFRHTGEPVEAGSRLNRRWTGLATLFRAVAPVAGIALANPLQPPAARLEAHEGKLVDTIRQWRISNQWSLLRLPRSSGASSRTRCKPRCSCAEHLSPGLPRRR